MQTKTKHVNIISLLVYLFWLIGVLKEHIGALVVL